jgi:hypothetical protein
VAESKVIERDVYGEIMRTTRAGCCFLLGLGDEAEYFCPKEEAESGKMTLRTRQTVVFDVVRGEQGKKLNVAVNVRDSQPRPTKLLEKRTYKGWTNTKEGYLKAYGIGGNEVWDDAKPCDPTTPNGRAKLTVSTAAKKDSQQETVVSIYHFQFLSAAQCHASIQIPSSTNVENRGRKS